MNKYLIILALFLFINSFFSILSFVFPTLPIDKTTPIQFWINALLIISLFLQNKVASFINNI